MKSGLEFEVDAHQRYGPGNEVKIRVVVDSRVKGRRGFDIWVCRL